MSAELRRPALLFASATLALAVALGIRPVSASTILSAYVLALAAVALGALIRVARGPSEWREVSQFERALRTLAEAPVRPPELVRTEREITLGSASANHLHTRLLPILRKAAAARLAAHHLVELDHRPDAAHALLGDEAWELLRPDRPAPVDRNAPGLPLRRIRALVDTLERL